MQVRVVVSFKNANYDELILNCSKDQIQGMNETRQVGGHPGHHSRDFKVKDADGHEIDMVVHGLSSESGGYLIGLRSEPVKDTDIIIFDDDENKIYEIRSESKMIEEIQLKGRKNDQTLRSR